MKVDAIKTRLFKTGENLVDFIIEHIKELEEKSIVVITSKIASLAENRVAEIKTDEEKAVVIKKESDYAYHHPHGWLTIVDGLMVGSAGLDASNVEGDYYSLLPKDSFEVASNVRAALTNKFSLKQLGVIVTDSRLMPLRKGTLGAAFGYAGFKALRLYAGTEDIYGRIYKRQKLNVPDSLATAAVFEMGEGKEQQPLAVITDAKVEFTNQLVEKEELVVLPEDDIYFHFYKNFPEKEQ